MWQFTLPGPAWKGFVGVLGERLRLGTFKYRGWETGVVKVAEGEDRVPEEMWRKVARRVV